MATLVKIASGLGLLSASAGNLWSNFLLQLTTLLVCVVNASLAPCTCAVAFYVPFVSSLKRILDPKVTLCNPNCSAQMHNISLVLLSYASMSSRFHARLYLS